MATYCKVSKLVPGSERSQLITNVAAGDRIDIIDVLGKPARGLKMITSDGTDTVEYKLNNLSRIRKRNEFNADETVYVWSESDSCPSYTDTGLVIETQDQLRISSIEIMSLILVVGTTIQIVVW